MGLFDDIVVDEEINLPEPRPKRRDFQTKGLGCGLKMYRITANGRLIQRRQRADRVISHDEEHHGELRFYTAEGSHATGDFKWFEYVAEFNEGSLVTVRKFAAARPDGGEDDAR